MGKNLAVALDQVRVAKFVAALKLVSDFVRTNRDFFSDLETWKQTGEMSPLILTFVEGFKLFSIKERKTFMEILKVLSMVLDENDHNNH